MPRYIGLDLGSKKTGIAITDSMGLFARELKTVFTNDLNAQLKKIIKENSDLVGLVIGLPKSKSGESEEKIRNFSENLKTEFNLPIYFEDERLTSWEAREILREQGYNSAKVKELEDQVAAKLILQSYLNRLTKNQPANI